LADCYCEDFLGGGREAQVSHSLDVLGSQTGIPKGLKKSEIAKGRRVLTILEFGGHRSSSILEIPLERGEGLK